MVRINQSNIDCLDATKPVHDPTTIGIDPGQKGAVAIIHYRKLSVFNYEGPVNAANLISELKKKYSPDFCIIEKQWIWPNEKDVKRAEVLIRSAQMWETLMYANNIKFITMSAKEWRKNLVPENMQNKEGYIEFANQTFSDSEHIFTRHDKAEASLIAYRAYFKVNK